MYCSRVRQSLSRRASRVLVVGVLVSAFALVSAPSSGAYLYWTIAAVPNADSCASNIGGAIARAKINGSGIDDRFIDFGGFGCHSANAPGPDDVSKLAVDRNHIYWIDLERDTIARANLNGTGVDDDFIHFSVAEPGGPEPIGGIAVDSGHIYWVNGTSGEIGRANLNGTDVEEQFITGAAAAGGIASAGGYLYWSALTAEEAPPTIARASVDGSGVDLGFIQVVREPGAAPVAAFAVTAGGGRIYWSSYDNTKIASASLDGSHLHQQLAYIHNTEITGLAVDRSHIYWVDNAEDAIGRADLNGAHVERHFIRKALNPVGIAVDGRG